MALGGLFAVGTGYVLFEDVIRGAQVTTDHVMTALVLVGAIAAGHFLFPAIVRKDILPALGLAALFGVGTFICVTSSASRGAEVSQAKALEARRINGEREAVAQDIRKAKDEREATSKRLATECGSGKGPRCAGLRSAIEYADSHIALLEARLSMMRPEQIENGGLKHAARVFALVSGAEAQAIERGLLLLWPFAKALMLEVATIVFLALGFGHKVSTVSKVAHAPETVSHDLETVLRALKKAGRPVSNDELARLLGVTKGEASKTVSKLEGHVRRERVGRRVQISLARGAMVH